MWQQHLQDIDTAIWIGYLFCFLAWLTKQRVVNSFLISFMVVVVFNGVMSQIAPLLYSASDNVNLNRLIWYFTFALIDLLAVWSILKAHKALKIQVDRNGMVISFTYLMLMLIQFSRYVDRQIISTNVLGEFYSAAIPTINILTLLYLVYTVSSYNNKKESVRG